MYSKSFFENFWATEQKNQLFVCMPFHDSFNGKFETIRKVAKKLGFDDAVRTKENKVANDLMHEIFDGIGNSKTLLFDLSLDPKELTANCNVIYELGVATTIREPEDMLIIKEEKTGEDGKFIFDIGHIRYNKHQGELSEDWLEPLLKNAVDNQKWYRSKRVAAAAKSINMDGLLWMLEINLNNFDSFNDANQPLERKLAILRLLELGIIFLNTAKNGMESAYYLTPFGKAVATFLGIQNNPPLSTIK